MWRGNTDPQLTPVIATIKPRRFSAFTRKRADREDKQPGVSSQLNQTLIGKCSSDDKALEREYSPAPSLRLANDFSDLASSPTASNGAADPSFQQLRDNIKIIRRATSSSNIDDGHAAYKCIAGISIDLCRDLSRKSLASIDMELAPHDSHASAADADLWLEQINDFKNCQETLSNKIQTSLETTYRSFKANATDEDIRRLFQENSFRAEAINTMRRDSASRLKSQDPDIWPRYDMRFRDYKRLKKDMERMESLIEESEAGRKPTHPNYYEISPRGDTILDFPNTGTDVPPLKFRVLSHVLAEFSPLFAQMFAADTSEVIIDPEMINDLPKEPYRQTHKDGSEVTVYRMPQVEVNEHEALTTLLHAAHLHTDKVPKNLEFDAFVSIAEVCLRYRCTSPVEWAVESRWLSHWKGAIGNHMREDHLLFISYVFNLEEVFTQTSKEVILHLDDEDELQEKTLWPKEVREKISAMRMAKMSQIQQCCNSVIQSYLRTGRTGAYRGTGISPLQPSSKPRCPRQSHICDAKNLGWSMLMFNELGMFPNIAGYATYQSLASQPGRSLQSVVQELKTIASTPDLHSEACDFVLPLRSAIIDIYGSIKGLTLDEVKGRTKSRVELPAPHIHELPLPVPSPNLAFSTDDDRRSTFNKFSGRNLSADDSSTNSNPLVQSYTPSGSCDRCGSTATSHSNNSGASDLSSLGSPVSPLTSIPDNDSSLTSKKEIDHILYSKPANKNTEGGIRPSRSIPWYPGSTSEEYHSDAKQSVKEMLPVDEAKYLREDLAARPVGI